MKNKLNISFILVAFFALLVGFMTTAQAQYSSGKKAGGYHLLNKIEVGGEGGWDALIADPDAHRLYVSHATKVIVIDTATDKVVGEIPNTNGVHGIAIAKKLGRGFTKIGRAHV